MPGGIEMNRIDEQRHAATMTMLEKMGQLADELMQEREERRELEESYRARMMKPEVKDDE